MINKLLLHFSSCYNSINVILLIIIKKTGDVIMGFLKEKYTKEYFLNIDKNGNALDYGALGGKEFLNGEIYYDIKDSLDLIDDISHKNILEIGFGRGDSIRYLYEKRANSYYGIDFSPASNEIAEQYVMSNIKNPNYEIYCDDALQHLISHFEQIKMRNINCIIMLDVIEHIPNEELNKILDIFDKFVKEDSLFCVHTPFYAVDEDYYKNRVYINPSPSDTNPHTSGMHCNKFTSKRFFRTLAEHNFYLYKSNKLFKKILPTRIHKLGFPQDNNF